jgi:hypothetical protein
MSLDGGVRGLPLLMSSPVCDFQKFTILALKSTLAGQNDLEVIDELVHLCSQVFLCLFNRYWYCCLVVLVVAAPFAQCKNPLHP